MDVESTFELPCPHCDRAFSTERSLRCHVKIHNERTLQCCFCDQKYNRTDSLFLHTLDHTTNGQILCRAEGCEVVVNSMLEGEKHAYVEHTENGTTVLKCPNCDETTQNFRKMLFHHTFKHGELKEFADEMFARQKEFLRLKKNHNRKMKRPVEVKEEVVMEEDDGEEHEEQFDGDGVLLRLKKAIGNEEGCESDEMICKLSELVAELFPLGSDEQYQCPHCKLGFCDAILWMTHLGFHDADEPFKCTGCGRSFSNRQTFVLHLTHFAHGTDSKDD